MFHLFNRVYIVNENFDTGHSAVAVVSRNPIDSLGQKFQNHLVYFFATDWDQLFSSSNQFKNIDQVLTFLSQKTEKIFIVCDTTSFFKLADLWLSLLISDSSAENIETIMKSYFFRYEMFYKSFLENQHDLKGIQIENVTLDRATENKKLKSSFKSWQDVVKADQVSVEFVLASYLAYGGYKESLKIILNRLIKKDLEKYLYELKEIMLVHLLQKRFINQFKLNENHDLRNFQNIIQSDHPAIQVFFDADIWLTKGMARHSSGRHINFKAIKPRHIKALVQFNDFAAGEWGEEGVYKFVKSDVSKLDFISFIDDHEKFDVDKVIDVESSFTNAAGSFFSIDLVTVNHYLVNHIFNVYHQKNHNELVRWTLKSFVQNEQ